MTVETIKGKLAAAKGFSNEHRLLSSLLLRGYNASRVDLPHSRYDIIVESGVESVSIEFIRIQVKTVSGSNSIGFTGGLRGGVDREYVSNVKEFVQNRETSDIVVGVDVTKINGDDKTDFYFIPTIVIEKLGQKSISINKIPNAKNNWDLLNNCKDENFVMKYFKDLFE